MRLGINSWAIERNPLVGIWAGIVERIAGGSVVGILANLEV